MGVLSMKNNPENISDQAKSGKGKFNMFIKLIKIAIDFLALQLFYYLRYETLKWDKGRILHVLFYTGHPINKLLVPPITCFDFSSKKLLIH